MFIIGSFLWLMFSEGDTYTIGGSNVNGVIVNEYTNPDGYDSSNNCYNVIKGTYSNTVRDNPSLPRIKSNQYGGYEYISR
jgi:hypothetical protein